MKLKEHLAQVIVTKGPRAALKYIHDERERLGREQHKEQALDGHGEMTEEIAARYRPLQKELVAAEMKIRKGQTP